MNKFKELKLKYQSLKSIEIFLKSFQLEFKNRQEMCFFQISCKTVPVFHSLIDKCLLTLVSSRKG